MIHKLHSEMSRLVKRDLGYIVPARLIVDIPISEVSYGHDHQLANEDLFIGAEARAFLEHEELSSMLMTKIYQTVRAFYVEVIGKMMKVFPLDSQLLCDLKVLDPASRLDISPETVTRLGCMFPQLRLDPDKLREEFTDYQVTDSKELTQEERVDRFWGLVGKSETETRFSQLASLMKALLCIPHSNASSESSAWSEKL